MQLLRGRRTSLRTAMVVVAVAGSLVLAGCGSGEPSGDGSGGPTAPVSLEGTSWVLATYAGAGGTSQSADSGSPALLAFSPASRLTGSTGCNTFGGTWTQDGDGLTLSTGPTTKKACPGALAAQETAVLAELQRVSTYAIVSGALRMKGADGAELLAYLPGLASLAGTRWSATGVNNGTGGVESLPAGVVITAEFGTDGMLAGNGGCNTYSGTYQEGEEGALELGPISATAKACPDPAGSTEALYLAALDSVTSYAIEGRSLTLRDAGGATQATYELA